jgi:hypothetical protein
MKKLLLLTTFLVSTSIFAHELTKEEEKVIYNYISLQLEQGKITQEQAQTMWAEQTKCCRDEKSA